LEKAVGEGVFERGIGEGGSYDVERKSASECGLTLTLNREVCPMLMRRILLVAAVLALSITVFAQTAEMAESQKAGGGKMEFEAATVRQNPTDQTKPSSINLFNDRSQPTDGLFHADALLSDYFAFAYKAAMAPEQVRDMVATMPDWSKAGFWRIEARSPGKPTRDQVRLMMQSLLAERFGLKAHVETRTVPALALVLVKPGKLGPKLTLHTEAPPCFATLPQGVPVTVSTPFRCGPFSVRPIGKENGIITTFTWGARNTTMEQLAASLPNVADLTKKVVDRTGLSGNYDVAVEFSMQATWKAEREVSAAVSSDAAADDGADGIPFLEAVREQLGLKLEPAKAPVEVLVIDHIERPSEN
jgi:bla regulator protein blaR1